MRLTLFEREKLKEEILLLLYKDERDYAYRMYRKIKSAVNYPNMENALRSLEKQGFIKPIKEGRRTYFELTKKGKQKVEKLIGGEKQ